MSKTNNTKEKKKGGLFLQYIIPYLTTTYAKYLRQIK